MLQQEVWWISAFSEDWISLTVPGQVCWFDRQSNRARDDRTGGHRNTKSASKPQIAWHCMGVEGRGVSRGCKECQWEPSCPGFSNWLNRPLVSWLWLAESLSTQKWLIRQYSEGEGGVFLHRPDKKHIFMCFTRIQEARSVSTLCNTTPPLLLF